MYYKLWKEKFVNELNIDLTSPYHLEGSNLAHTLMVYNEICHSPDNNIVMKISALLHDIGKRKALQIIDGKNITQGHEGISTFMAAKYLFDLVIENIITYNEMMDILFIVNHHGDLMKYKDSKKYWDMWAYETHKLKWIRTFNKYDILGRISEKEFNQPDIKIVRRKIKKHKKQNKPTVYFMIGVPNAGKSTFAKKLKLNIVSRDQILLDYGKEKYGLNGYSDIWKMLTDKDQKEIDKILFDRIKDLQNEKQNFIIDMTLTSVKSRKSMLNRIKGEYQIVYINVLTDYETIMERNKERFEKEGKLIPEDVIISMMKKYQMPLYGEDDRIIDIKYVFT